MILCDFPVETGRGNQKSRDRGVRQMSIQTIVQQHSNYTFVGKSFKLPEFHSNHL